MNILITTKREKDVSAQDAVVKKFNDLNCFVDWQKFDNDRIYVFPPLVNSGYFINCGVMQIILKELGFFAFENNILFFKILDKLL